MSSAARAAVPSRHVIVKLLPAQRQAAIERNICALLTEKIVTGDYSIDHSTISTKYCLISTGVKAV